MPRTTDVTQPPRFEDAPSILLTFSSSKPSTGARLATLARGILAANPQQASLIVVQRLLAAPSSRTSVLP